MPVVNAYVEANLAAGKIAAAAQGLGAGTRVIAVTFEVAAADDDGSIYRIAKGLSPDLIPLKIEIYNDAITGGTVWDLGFYGVLDYDNVGAVVSDNVLMTAKDLSAAHASGSPLDGLTAVDQADRVKRIYELCGHTQITKLPAYDLCLTADTVGSAAGTVTVLAWFLQG